MKINSLPVILCAGQRTNSNIVYIIVRVLGMNSQTDIFFIYSFIFFPFLIYYSYLFIYYWSLLFLIYMQYIRIFITRLQTEIFQIYKISFSVSIQFMYKFLSFSYLTNVQWRRELAFYPITHRFWTL